MSSELENRLAGLVAKAQSDEKEGTKKSGPKTQKLIHWTPLYEEKSDHVPADHEVVRGSYERFLDTFSQELSIVQYVVFEGKQKFFSVGSGLINNALIEMYSNPEVLDSYPEEAKLTPISYYILTESWDWKADIEEKIVTQLQILNVPNVEYPETEEE
jgi:hypothetical protein